MRSLFFGILFVLLVGIGGFMYRNAVEYSARPIACTLDALVCPDGTALGRTGPSCTFPACPPPNVSLSDVGIAFAVPEGFSPAELPDSASVASYRKAGPTPEEPAEIIIRRYAIAPSSTALATIQETAIGGASGEPVPSIAYSSTVLGAHRYTVVSIERFEAVVDTAYYLARGADVLRFDAIDRGVVNWTDPDLDTAALPAAAALRQLLAGLQGE
ncbi:hypothetical protein HYT04_00370 [Candidatus Kaiserbacteria bacterium]|nr:hypothetical protein [Candidatus Kaiserbacteria bacterium]